LLSAPLWLVGFGGAVIGNATFGVCTGTQDGPTDVSLGGKCINTDVAGAAIYPYTGYIFLPTGTNGIADVFAYHVPAGSVFPTVSGTYSLTLTDASSISHTYTYVVPVGTSDGWPVPPAGLPIKALGFTSTGQVFSYTLSINPDTTTYPTGINTSLNQVYYYDSEGTRTGQDRTNSVKFTAPSQSASPSPSSSPSASPSPSSSPSASPSPSSSPSAGASPTPIGGNLGVPTSSPTPSGAGAVQPAQNAAGAAGAQGAQGAGLTSPNTGLDPAIPLLLSLFGVFGGLVLLASARKQPRT